MFNQRGIVFPVNNFHSSRFKSLELYINNMAITKIDSLYAYRCYLETLLSYGRGAKESLLWAKDTNPDGNFTKMEEECESDLTEDCNIGGWQRFQVSKFSTCFETMGKIHADILAQERLLPSNCELRLRFHRADPAFALMAKHDSEKFTIAIDTAMLMVRHVEVSPAIREVHTKAALSSTYPFHCHSVVVRIIFEAICEAVSYSAALPQRSVPYRKNSPLTSTIVCRRTAGNLSCFDLEN